MTTHRLRASLFIAAALTTTMSAQGAGFGRMAVTAVMGQPLQLTVPVQLAEGEALTPDCLAADILSGDSRVPAHLIRFAVSAGGQPGEWIARVSTLVPIEEPVVEISVSAGCSTRLSRRMTVFADPPVGLSTPPVALSTLTPPVQVDDAGTVATAAPARAAARRSEPASKPRGRSPMREPTPAKSATRRTIAAAAAAAAPAAAGGRLQLDVGEDMLARMPTGTAASAPLAVPPQPASEASAVLATDADRLRQMESALAQLKADSQRFQSGARELQVRLDRSEQRAQALPWLAGVALLLLCLSLALVWRLRHVARDRARSSGPWWTADDGAPAADHRVRESATPEDDDEPAPSQLEAQTRWRDAGNHALDLDPTEEVPLDEPAGTAGFRPQPHHPGLTPPERFNAAGTMPFDPIHSPAREVSVEELLDLEQQADFFIALGQEEAAIDLLMAYLRSTGGLSPLPYTKLLEIYRRQGDRSAYERIRARFNRRFNAYAPDWEVGPQAGRWLEDYPQAIRQLQAVWPMPIDAMAVLEAMLFRRDETQDLFDLPAYKDVLLMYSIARDLWHLSGPDAQDVDLLLPLTETHADAGIDTEIELNERDLDLSLDSVSGGRSIFELDPSEPLPADPSSPPKPPR